MSAKRYHVFGAFDKNTNEFFMELGVLARDVNH